MSSTIKSSVYVIGVSLPTKAKQALMHAVEVGKKTADSEVYRENECKLLEYIRALSKCETLDEVIDIYRQAIKP